MVWATARGEGTTGVLGHPTSGRGGASRSPSVLVCDPVSLSRVAVREVLERNGFRVDTSARTAEEAVALVERDRPDVCIVDARAPGGGLEATRRICAAEPGVPVVVMADTLSTDELFEAVRAGAVGYLPKQMDPERL
ncbi:MAG TPA: response regulator, partial [Frankiaceae bacterium]|nr:response regulator [Frankiaceae bacterium]